MFWSGETLEKHIQRIIVDENGNSLDKEGKPYGKPDKIDCAGYTLTIGPEILITQDKQMESSKGPQKCILQEKEIFWIPPGQFAFIITEEFVKIPDDMIAFISLKTGDLKFRGLINVSGFHVDPGYYGRLMFSVFHAGPQKIALSRGQEFAVIWFSKLDKTSDEKSYKRKKGVGPHNEEIPISIIDRMSGEVYSPMVIRDKLERLEKEINDIDNNIEHKLNKYKVGALIAILVFVLVTVVGEMMKKWFLSPTPSLNIFIMIGIFCGIGIILGIVITVLMVFMFKEKVFSLLNNRSNTKD